MSATDFGQFGLNAGAAIGLAAVPVDLEDQLREQRVVLGAGTGLGLALAPVVIAAGGDLEGCTQRANGLCGLHGVNPFEALAWGSERMPKVFFKISRCWRR